MEPMFLFHRVCLCVRFSKVFLRFRSTGRPPGRLPRIFIYSRLHITILWFSAWTRALFARLLGTESSFVVTFGNFQLGHAARKHCFIVIFRQWKRLGRRRLCSRGVDIWALLCVVLIGWVATDGRSQKQTYSAECGTRYPCANWVRTYTSWFSSVILADSLFSLERHQSC